MEENSLINGYAPGQRQTRRDALNRLVTRANSSGSLLELGTLNESEIENFTYGNVDFYRQ